MCGWWFNICDVIVSDKLDIYVRASILPQLAFVKWLLNATRLISTIVSLSEQLIEVLKVPYILVYKPIRI